MKANDRGLVQAGHCRLSSPELKPIKEIKYKLNTKSPTEFRPDRTTVQRCKHPKFKRQALAQNPML